MPDKRWCLGLAATVVVCLLASAALSAYLFETLDRGDVDAWMQSVGSESVARVALLPETLPAPQATFVAAGQSPFDPQRLRSHRQGGR